MRAKFIVVVAFLFVFFIGVGRGQVVPAEGAVLHYRLIGFVVPAHKHSALYIIEVAQGMYKRAEDFQEHILWRFKGTGNEVVGEVPQWGATYTWRVVYDGEEKDKLQHFSTCVVPVADTNSTRMRVTKNTEKYKDCYVFADGERALYDVEGRAVWYLPNIPGVVGEQSVVRDLKATAAGTITFLSDEQAVEVSYDGKVLWKAPKAGTVSGDTTEHFHHEFTRLGNGDYMVLGNEYVYWNVASTDFGGGMVVFDANGKRTTGTVGRERLEFGTLIRYNRKGEVVWKWKSADYFKQTYEQKDRLKKDVLQSHANAFYFDEKQQLIYVSFKNLGQVLTVKYPEGTVTSYVGKMMDTVTHRLADGAVCEQHSCKVLRDGRLCVFNNNMCRLEEQPEVAVYGAGETWDQVVWRYQCPGGSGRRSPMTQGGNVVELRDGDLFVSMCSPYGKLFIVNKDKELLWEAVMEHYSAARQRWEEAPQYRASAISDSELLHSLLFFGVK